MVVTFAAIFAALRVLVFAPSPRLGRSYFFGLADGSIGCGDICCFSHMARMDTPFLVPILSYVGPLDDGSDTAYLNRDIRCYQRTTKPPCTLMPACGKYHT